MEAKPGWLYSVKDGELVVEFGEALIFQYSGTFEVSRTRRISISREPWTIHNNFLWCPNVERDDVKAVQMMIEHEDREIYKHRVQIKLHNDRFNNLQIILMKLQREQIKEKRKEN